MKYIEMDDDMLTVCEVAGILRLNERTVRRYLARGYLIGFRLAGPERRSEWRIPRRSLDRLGVEGTVLKQV